MQKGLNKIDQEWVPLQARVFTRWFVAHLNGQGTVDVEDVTTDLSSGVALVELAQILTGKTAQRAWKKEPKSKFEEVQNCDLALEMFEQDGVVLVGMSGKDINDKNKKLCLGLVWTLILHYSIGASVSTPSATSERSSSVASLGDALKSWAIERTKNYKYVKEFQPFDMSICALLDSYYPNEVGYDNLNPAKPQQNLIEACKCMEKHNIDILVYPDDLRENDIDEKTLLTQLSAIKTVVDTKSTTTIQSRSITSTTSTASPQSRSVAASTATSSSQSRSTTSSTTTSSSQSRSTTSSTTASEFQSRSTVPNTSSSQSSTQSVQQRSVNLQEQSGPVDGNNNSYDGRRFALTLTLSADEYNRLQTDSSRRINGATTVSLALTLVNPDHSYLNPAGLKLDLTHPNVDYDRNQQFTFGKGEWNTVIDSYARPGMVWDVANQYDLNPPEGTEFYLFPFHGRHNQHFVYKNKHIYAKQNGHVVTYNGGDKPLVMRKLSNELQARQTFEIRLL